MRKVRFSLCWRVLRKHRDSYPELLIFQARCSELAHLTTHSCRILAEIQLLFDDNPWSEPRRKEDDNCKPKGGRVTSERRASGRGGDQIWTGIKQSFSMRCLCYRVNLETPSGKIDADAAASPRRTCHHRIRQVSCSITFDMRSSRLHGTRLTVQSIDHIREHRKDIEVT